MAKLPSEAIEVINRNALVSLALARGYIAYLPVYDAGIDFILYSEATDEVVKVQLKGRWTIDTKYKGRGISIAFPDRGNWYLVPHDELVRMADGYGFTATGSWTKPGGAYSYAKLSKRMIGDLDSYRFGDLEKVADEAERAAEADASE